MAWENYDRTCLGVPTDYLNQKDRLPLVSVVVPVYNTPVQLLNRCVNSLLEQTYRSIELILVDDGSDKLCRESLDEAIRMDSRARILDSGHRGVSHARNVGIDASVGDWIVFADADDEVAPYFIEEALSIALGSGADFVCGHSCPLFDGSTKPISDNVIEYYEVACESDIRLLQEQMIARYKSSSFSGPDFHGRGPVAKLYRKKLMDSLRFDESLALGEDVFFNYQYLGRCDSVALANRKWYWYYQYESSASHASSLGKWKDAIDFYLNAPRRDGERGCFLTHCGDETFHAAEMFVRRRGVVGGYRPSVDLFRYVSSQGCFSPPSFQGFEVRFWVRLTVALCERGLFGTAYFFLAFKTIVKSFVGKKPLKISQVA